MTRPACMSPEEYQAWLETNAKLYGDLRAETPCSDCTIPFAEEQRKAGTCDGEPGVQHQTEHRCGDGSYCRACQRDAARAVAIANYRAKREAAVARARQLAAEGHPRHHIARLMGVVPSTVTKYLNDLGRVA